MTRDSAIGSAFPTTSGLRHRTFAYALADLSSAILTCVLGGAVVAEGKNRDAQISQVENNARTLPISMI